MPVKCGLNSEVAATQRLGIAGVHCIYIYSFMRFEYDIKSLHSLWRLVFSYNYTVSLKMLFLKNNVDNRDI